MFSLFPVYTLSRTSKCVNKYPVSTLSRLNTVLDSVRQVHKIHPASRRLWYNGEKLKSYMNNAKDRGYGSPQREFLTPNEGVQRGLLKKSEGSQMRMSQAKKCMKRRNCGIRTH